MTDPPRGPAGAGPCVTAKAFCAERQSREYAGPERLVEDDRPERPASTRDQGVPGARAPAAERPTDLAKTVERTAPPVYTPRVTLMRVIVVGGGWAGCAAALQARRQGA